MAVLTLTFLQQIAVWPQVRINSQIKHGYFSSLSNWKIHSRVFFCSAKKNVFFSNRLHADDTHIWPRQLSRHTDDLKKVTETYKHSHPQYSTHVIPWPIPPSPHGRPLIQHPASAAAGNSKLLTRFYKYTQKKRVTGEEIKLCGACWFISKQKAQLLSGGCINSFFIFISNFIVTNTSWTVCHT